MQYIKNNTKPVLLGALSTAPLAASPGGGWERSAVPLRPALGGPGGRGTRSPRCGHGRRPRGDPRSGLSLGSGDGAAGGWGPVFNSVPFSPWEKPGARCVTRASVRGGCGTPEPGFWVLGWLWDPPAGVLGAGLAVGPPNQHSQSWAGCGTPEPAFWVLGWLWDPPALVPGHWAGCGTPPAHVPGHWADWDPPSPRSWALG